MHYLSELQAAQHQYADWQQLQLNDATVHIAVMIEPFLSTIFTGQKTVESRFSLQRRAPYQRVQAGELIFLKAGPLVGCFTAAWVKNYDFTSYDIRQLEHSYRLAIGGDEQFWEQKRQQRFATLIGIKNVQKLTPVSISKRDRRTWVVIEPTSK